MDYHKKYLKYKSKYKLKYKQIAGLKKECQNMSSDNKDSFTFLDVFDLEIPSEKEVFRCRYKIIQKERDNICGKGGFKTVYLAYDKDKDNIVIISKLDIKRQSERIPNEISILEHIDCPYIINLENKLITNNNIYLVFEYASKGTLEDYIEDIHISIDQIPKILYYILKGLNYLHNILGVMTRDLKPDNIVITSNDDYKLIDFGLASKYITDDKSGNFPLIKPNEIPLDPGISVTETMSKKGKLNLMGTPYYMSPELCDRKTTTYNFNVDIYALGVILMILVLSIKSKDIHSAKGSMSIMEYQFETKKIYDQIASISKSGGSGGSGVDDPDEQEEQEQEQEEQEEQEQGQEAEQKQDQQQEEQLTQIFNTVEYPDGKSEFIEMYNWKKAEGELDEWIKGLEPKTSAVHEEPVIKSLEELKEDIFKRELNKNGNFSDNETSFLEPMTFKEFKNIENQTITFKGSLFDFFKDCVTYPEDRKSTEYLLDTYFIVND